MDISLKEFNIQQQELNESSQMNSQIFFNFKKDLQ